MPKHWAHMLAGAALLSGCAPAPVVAPAVAPMTAERAAAEAACASLAEVDVSAIPREPEDWSWVEPLHQRARQGAPPPPQGTPLLKVAIPAAGIGAPRFDFSIFAARQSDGSWLVSRARHLRVPPPPQGPNDNHAERLRTDPALRGGVFAEGRLSGEAARRLEAALASNCLAKQPRVEPSPLPMRSGGDLACPPDAGALHALEIVEPAGSRRFVHSCGRQWASGLIIVLLESSPLEPA